MLHVESSVTRRFHLNAFAYWLFGASDYTARLVPALLGVFLVWFPWKFRAWLGTVRAPRPGPTSMTGSPSPSCF